MNWLIVQASRDPIGEEGGTNLLAMLSNGPVGQVDRLGESPAILAVVAVRLAWVGACALTALERANRWAKELQEERRYEPHGYQLHCYIGCWQTRCSLELSNAMIGEILHEVFHGIRKRHIDWPETYRDILETAKGVVAAFSFSSCKTACLCAGPG